MTLGTTSPDVDSVAAYLLQRYDRHVAALMAYGSRVVGQARIGSAFDFWLIVRDADAFHADNAEFYLTNLNVPSTPEAQAALNRTGPIFYALTESGVSIKMGVLEEQNLLRLCGSDWWTVKGRMQKPLRMIRTSPVVEEAILSARRDGLAAGLSLAPAEFTMEELLTAIVSLSYRAEIRPERKASKVRSILRTGRAALEEIYRPLLAELSFIEARGDRFFDRRSDEDRRRLREATRRSLRRSKWSRKSFGFIWRNYCSHQSPLRYVLMKIFGEVQKPIARRLPGKRGAAR